MGQKSVKKSKYLIVVLVLVMCIVIGILIFIFTTLNSGLDINMMLEQLADFCELSSEEQEMMYAERSQLFQFREQLEHYCQLNTIDEQLAYIEEQISEFENKN